MSKENNIVIIDHEGFDQKQNRRLAIRNRLVDLGQIVTDYPFVYGHIKREPEDISQTDFDNIVSADIYFIHRNNFAAQDFIVNVLQKNKSVIIVEYSGGGITNKSSEDRHLIVTEPVGEDGLIKNLTYILEFKKNYNPILEVKLKLLYKLLKPFEKPEELKKYWENYKDKLRESKSFDLYSNAWDIFLRNIQKKYSKTIHAKVYQEELTLLRDILLGKD